MPGARWVLVLGVLITLAAGAVAAGTLDALSLNRFEAPGSESMRAKEALADRFGTGSPNLALLVTARQGTVDDPEVAEAGRELTRELAARVGDAWSYWTRGSATLRSRDARQALVLAWIPGDADTVRRTVLPALVPSFTRDGPLVRVEVGGGDEVFRQVMEQARADFLRAELVVLPMVLLLLWLVYRRFAAALVTLAVGIAAVAGSLALIRVVTLFTDVSTFAANLALVMGVGLGVDYGLFVVFRFREELGRGAEVAEAVARTVRTAGRTVLFSGVTVAAALAVLLAFPFPFLRSFGYAGLAVVAAAVPGATVLLPAALRLLGHWVTRRRAAPPSVFWGEVATRVMRRPFLLGGAALALVLLLGSPFLGIRFGLPDDRVLPESAPARQLYDQVRAGFPVEEADAVQVVAPGGSLTAAYAAELSRIEGVARVDSAAGSFTGGRPVEAPGGTRYAAGGASRLSVVASGDRLGLVADIRAVAAPVEVVVGGYPAELTDYRDGVVGRLPLVAGLIVLVTCVVLFVMSGSLVAPLKAAVLNLLSLSVMFGALVFLFQDRTGSIEPSIPILMFCVAYALSMDYEVFLLSRIKEEYDRTGDVVSSVPNGIARSAPLVTAAAAILAASFAVYATSGVVFLQMLGVGMALAVVVDATIIRGVLLPAAMALAGQANWWAPRSLRRRGR
ncbi:MMPL family transporter [Herbidospora sp. NEAU-GS84]|uniref:MMPL family transporter n=1 Tax=Herbidospora solisilvae TaxID=2696284 RepID=A0A7C9J3T0_9ACTN|nr:MMPL family transporter [Herbidospora solisilvae]NAS23625.1 MMPL family transporter [Herbidospora solisilvae]